jgi:hypothetical protein
LFPVSPEEYFCHACSHAPQTMRHFIYTCPLAKAVWSSFRSFFQLPFPVNLHHALYSWPSSTTSRLGRSHGFRLQAGHAVALHVLWTAHCSAVYDQVPSTPATVRVRFLALLRRHFQTISSSRYANRLT